MFDAVGCGNRIKKRRNELKLTQNELASKVHITTEMVSRIENAKRGFSVDVLCHLIKELDVTADYILFGVSSSDDDEKNELIEQLEEIICKYK